MRRLSEVPTPIIECAYDPSAGTWRLHAIRTDKAQPNHIKVVFDTMESIAENISREEIVKLLAEGPHRHPAQAPPGHHNNHHGGGGGGGDGAHAVGEKRPHPGDAGH